MKILNEEDKAIYELFMATIPVTIKYIKDYLPKDLKAPVDFENHAPCEDSKDW